MPTRLPFSVVSGEQAVVGGRLTGSELIRKLLLHRLDGGGPHPGGPSARRALKRMSMELGGAARPCWSSTTPTWTWPSKARSPASSAPAARPASVPTGSMSKPGCARRPYLAKLTERGGGAEGRRPPSRPDGGDRAADRRERRGQGRGPHRRAPLKAGGKLLHRRAGACRPVLPADRHLRRRRLPPSATRKRFGPSSPVFSFETPEEEAISRANASGIRPGRLPAILQRPQPGHAGRAGHRVWHQVRDQFRPDLQRFEPLRRDQARSGFGREGSTYGIEDYLQVKARHWRCADLTESSGSRGGGVNWKSAPLSTTLD